MLVDNLGKGIVLREMIALLYAATCLLMPFLGYAVYTVNNPLARLWVKYMPIPEAKYFDFALPAISFFCLAITLPLSFKNEADKGVLIKQTVQKIRESIGSDHKTGLYIMGFGLVISFFVNALPSGLQFFATICFFASFAGLLYVFFAPRFPYKGITIFLFIGFILINALNSGMFTIVAYMGITIFSFFYLGRKARLIKKILFLLVGVLFFLVLQNTKKTYRSYIWRSSQYEGNKALLFGELFLENLQLGDALIEKSAFFPVYVRTNQGFNVGLVMRRIPALVPHDDGKYLFITFASSVVPRLLWPDKPKAGGKFNMRYYTGWNISGWSTNVGPLGEAYGGFGVNGGIIYMLLLGLFIRVAYKLVFRLAARNPLLICWLPVLFFQVTYSAETDTMQILNSLLKTAFFIYLVSRIVPMLFHKVNREHYFQIPSREVSGLQN
jgi:hypothetical protein